MDNTGLPVTIDALAREASVSRSWIYNQPDRWAEAQRLRDRQHPGPGRPVPDRQRSSDASLQRRVEVATHRIRELETDNKRLRHALAEALGERRAAPTREQQRDTPRLRTSPPIGTARTATSATPSTTQNTNSKP
ncbi:MAG: transposase [Pseudonocardiaceae bacterium]